MGDVVADIGETILEISTFGLVDLDRDKADPEVTKAPKAEDAQLDIEGAKLRSSKRRRQRLLRGSQQPEETLGSAAPGQGPKKLLGQ